MELLEEIRQWDPFPCIHRGGLLLCSDQAGTSPNDLFIWKISSYFVLSHHHAPVLYVGFAAFCLPSASHMLSSGSGDTKAKEGTQEKRGGGGKSLSSSSFACSPFVLSPSQHGTDVVCIIIDFKCEEKRWVLPMINLWSLISSAHPHQAEPCRESGDRDPVWFEAWALIQ